MILCAIAQELSYLKLVWKSKLGTLRISSCSQEPPQFPSDFPIRKEKIINRVIGMFETSFYVAVNNTFL